MAYDTAFYAPALWARVRDDYLAGDSSEVVCARHGVSRSQLFAQARAGGWRRSDLPAADVAEARDEDDGAPAPPTAELAGEALRRGAHAVAAGRLHEAQGWVALAARLRALAKDERDHDGWRRFLPATPVADPTSLAKPEPAPAAAASSPDTPSAPADGVDLARAVGRLAAESVELYRRLEAGEDVADESRALSARVEALEAQHGAHGPPPSVAPEVGGRACRPGPDCPAGLPPASGVSAAAMAAALGWEASQRPAGDAWLGG